MDTEKLTNEDKAIPSLAEVKHIYKHIHMASSSSWHTVVHHSLNVLRQQTNAMTYYNNTVV